MYTAKIELDGKEEYFYHPDDPELILIDPAVTQGMGTTDGFKFQIPPTHPRRDMVRLLRSMITVYDDGEILFRGRPWKTESNIDNITAVTCEGELAYLLDSVVAPFNFTGSVYEFFKMLIDNHNSQVEETKRFVLGNVTVTGDGNDIHFESDQHMKSSVVLGRYLLKVYGGSPRVRYAGVRYVDYLYDYGDENPQPIKFGENLIKLDRYADLSTFATVIIPTGAKIASEKGGDDKTLDISSVNGGRNYLVDREAYDTYGWKCEIKSFDDVTDPETLMKKGQAYLQEQLTAPEGIKANALDLGIIDTDMKKLKTGCWTTVESAPHGLKKKFLLKKRTYHLLDPAKDTVELGGEIPTLTSTINQNYKDTDKKIDQVSSSASKDINRKVENATQLITGGKGGYVVIDVQDPDTGEKTHPWRILVMNTPDKDTATNVIQLNQNGIGFSTTGINGPYRNAWTIDGNLVADFITSGAMLADRIRGGVLELGGSGIGRDGRIVVKDTNDQVIGYWDKTGLHVFQGVLNGPAIIGGTINIGHGTFTVDADGSISIGDLFYADEGVVKFGDYTVSANGTNELKSVNGLVELNCNSAEPGWPIGKYATLHLGGEGSVGVTLNGGNGKVDCGDVTCGDIRANKCKLAEGSDRKWGIGETIDWFWEEFKKLRDRVDNIS